MFYHTVYIFFKEGVDTARQEETLCLLQKLGLEQYKPLVWSVGRNEDKRPKEIVAGRAVDIVLLGIFPNRETFEGWKNSASHKNAGVGLKEVADWLVGDFSDDVKPIERGQDARS